MRLFYPENVPLGSLGRLLVRLLPLLRESCDYCYGSGLYGQREPCFARGGHFDPGWLQGTGWRIRRELRR